MENDLIKIDEKSMAFVLMDKLDDALIIQELEGRMPDVLTYHFKEKGQEIWGLSKAGVDEAKAVLATNRGEVIREIEMKFTDGKDEALFQVQAARFCVYKDGKEVMLDTAFGFKRQAKKYANGNLNPFWYEQGAIKACRNATFRLIPKTVTESIIEFAKKQGKVQEVKPITPETFDSWMENRIKKEKVPAEKIKASLDAYLNYLSETNGILVDEVKEKTTNFPDFWQSFIDWIKAKKTS